LQLVVYVWYGAFEIKDDAPAPWLHRHSGWCDQAPSDLFSGACVGGVGEFLSVDVVVFPSAALLAAHRAFMAAAS